jgi:hypothetical protein
MALPDVTVDFCLLGYVITNVSEEHFASIFRVESL